MPAGEGPPVEKIHRLVKGHFRTLAHPSVHDARACDPTSYDRRMRRLLVVCIVAVPVFLALARWNGVLAVFFAIAVLAFVLSTLYWKFGAEDPFAGAIERHEPDIYGDSRERGKRG